MGPLRDCVFFVFNLMVIGFQQLTNNVFFSFTGAAPAAACMGDVFSASPFVDSESLRTCRGQCEPAPGLGSQADHVERTLYNTASTVIAAYYRGF
jgi:hypothetical protein